MTRAEKVIVPEKYWDNMFAPSSALAIITTVDAHGAVNAASFGTCTRVNHNPVYVAFTCTVGKDTTNNALATGQFVANIVPFEPDMLDRTLACGLAFRPGVNELDKAGLTGIPGLSVKPPRIAECRVHFECAVDWSKQWLDRVMFCGKVVAVSADADCINSRGEIVWERARPAHYCGGPYKDRFVPVFDKPTRGVWRNAVPEETLSDAEFRPGDDWRASFRSAG